MPTGPVQFSHFDLIQSAPWRAALFTSFPLSLSFFEAAPLIKLRAGNCRQITILADVLGYAASLSERGSVGDRADLRAPPHTGQRRRLLPS